MVDASCGAMHCVAVSGCGEVFSWGNNKYGQLGHDESKDHISLPGIVPGLMGIFINAVSCGGGHTIVTTKDGLVYSWGMGTNGQLGLGTTETVFRPQRITALGSLAVTAVATGLAHSLFLSSDGSVFSCGMNTCGALGQNTGGDSVLFPSPIHIESRDSGTVKYVHISAGGMFL